MFINEFSLIIEDFLVGAFMGGIAWIAGAIYRWFKKRHLPLDTVEEERLIAYTEIDEKEVILTLEKWGVESKVAQTVVQFFVTTYRYVAGPEESFTIIGTIDAHGDEVYVTTKNPVPSKNPFKKVSITDSNNENTIVLTQETMMISGGVFLRNNVPGVTWRVTDVKDNRKVFIVDKKGINS